MRSSAVESLSARAYTIPTDEPEADGTVAWTSTTIVVVTVRCAGVTGIGWTYGPPAITDLAESLLADSVIGCDPMSVAGMWSGMVATARNATRAGAVGYAISAIDMALWDLKARLLDVALADLFGRVHHVVPVYGSGGFTTYTNERMIGQLTSWTKELDIPRVKIKIGQDRGTNERRDLERIGVAREAIGPDVELYVDANGAYGRKQAVRVMHAAADARVTWFEEPVSSDDLSGLCQVRSRVDADVAAGEYGTDAYYFRRMCAAEAVDCLQIDATRCGGYTEWLRSAAVAQSFGLDVSAHCAPNIHAHVGAAVPNIRHLEWFHDHVRIENQLFEHTLDPDCGDVRPDASRPGNGVEFDAEKAAQFAV